MVPPQQPLPSFLDIIGHFPPEQQAALPSELLDIIGQVLPSFPWQQPPPLQQSPSFALHLESLPQQLILPSAWSWLQQAQDFAALLSVDGVVCDPLWAIIARAITSVLTSMRAFDFMVSSESRMSG
jgi:hypothetical protein